MRETPIGGAVLILAEDYPAKRVQLDDAAREMAEAKQLRTYVEYPEALQGLIDSTIRTRTAGWERGVVSADVFGDALPPRRILALHQCEFIPTKADNPGW